YGWTRRTGTERGRMRAMWRDSQRPLSRSECVVFFFSSRRRHTRSKRDWSSDVCSSDLILFQPADRTVTVGHPISLQVTAVGDDRSEERRVGKEWRSRWLPYR